jgi:hypothetical protein
VSNKNIANNHMYEILVEYSKMENEF